MRTFSKSGRRAMLAAAGEPLEFGDEPERKFERVTRENLPPAHSCGRSAAARKASRKAPRRQSGLHGAARSGPS
jgi:hypothetical protein